MNFDREEFRRKFREEWERNWIRDSLRLRGKKPEETLEAMFDLCGFAEKLHGLGER